MKPSKKQTGWMLYLKLIVAIAMTISSSIIAYQHYISGNNLKMGFSVLLILVSVLLFIMYMKTLMQSRATDTNGN